MIKFNKIFYTHIQSVFQVNNYYGLGGELK